jgi:hypothetical protein
MYYFFQLLYFASQLVVPRLLSSCFSDYIASRFCCELLVASRIVFDILFYFSFCILPHNSLCLGCCRVASLITFATRFCCELLVASRIVFDILFYFSFCILPHHLFCLCSYISTLILLWVAICIARYTWLSVRMCLCSINLHRNFVSRVALNAILFSFFKCICIGPSTRFESIVMALLYDYILF